MDRSLAERRPRIESGGVAQIEDDCHRVLWLHIGERVSQDFRYGLRALARRPFFAACAILILALGLAANTLVFSVTDSVLLRALPFREPDQLVAAWERHPIIGRQPVALPDFHDWQARSRSFAVLAAYTTQGEWVPLWTGTGHAEPIEATQATWNLFPLLGVKPLAGRVFTEDEDRPGHEHVVLLSRRLWTDRFGANPNAIGRSMVMDGEPYQILGVLPDGQALPPWADVWVPLARTGPDTQPMRAGHNLEAIGRLRRGVSVEQADAEIQSIAEQLAVEYPVTNGPTRANVVPLRKSYVEGLEKALVLLQAGAALVLLICCANVAIFCLVRAAERRTEAGVRAALGASPAQLFCGALAEAVAIALAGGGLALALARVAFYVIRPRIAQLLPVAWALEFDWKTTAFCFGVCLLTALIFGALPSLHTMRQGALLGATRTVTGRHTAARSLIVTQTALAMVVVVSTGLMAQSFRAILRVQPGFEARRLLTVQFSLPVEKYQNATELSAFYGRLFPKLKALPGVTAVAESAQRPLRRGGGRFWINGRPDPPPNQFPVAQFRAVSPEFFQTVGLRLSAGRMPYSGGETGQTVWVNRSFERRFFGDTSAVGHSILLGLFRPRRVRIPIAGVVSDMRDLGLETNPEPTVYFIELSAGGVLLVRTAEMAAPLDRGIRAALQESDPEAWAGRLDSMDGVYAGALRDRQLALELLAVFAVVACLLAGLGIQAVVAQAVTERTREIGLRMAVGAGPGSVILLFLLTHLRAVAVGLVAGTLLAMAAAGLLKRMLFGVGAVDATTYWLTAMLIFGVTLTAAYLAARRVVRIDPVAALRAE